MMSIRLLVRQLMQRVRLQARPLEPLWPVQEPLFRLRLLLLVSPLNSAACLLLLPLRLWLRRLLPPVVQHFSRE